MCTDIKIMKVMKEINDVKNYRYLKTYFWKESESKKVQNISTNLKLCE